MDVGAPTRIGLHRSTRCGYLVDAMALFMETFAAQNGVSNRLLLGVMTCYREIWPIVAYFFRKNERARQSPCETEFRCAHRVLTALELVFGLSGVEV